MGVPLTGNEVNRARERISPHIVNTPFAFSRVLSKLTGAKVYLKFENLQFTAAFKERGALNRLLTLTREQVKPDITLIGVQSDRFPAAKQHLEGKPVKTERYTVAEGIAVRNPGRKTLPILRDHLEEILLVGEEEPLRLLRIHLPYASHRGGEGIYELVAVFFLAAGLPLAPATSGSESVWGAAASGSASGSILARTSFSILL